MQPSQLFNNQCLYGRSLLLRTFSDTACSMVLEWIKLDRRDDPTDSLFDKIPPC